jgi:hypothetical protein
MRQGKYFLIICIIVFNTAALMSQVLYDPPQKKLIEFGWNSPFIREYKADMNLYESGPFDGVTLRLSQEAGGGNVFMVRNWEKIRQESREAEKKLVLSLSKSTKLTENFLVLYGASQLDWFSDSDWKVAEDQIRFAAGLALAAGCKGILWDPEPYKPGKNPWRYTEQERKGEYSFEEYYKQVRKRGAQFIRTLQEEFPGITILSLRELSDWQDGSPFSGALLPVTDRESTLKELTNSWWSLHPAFYVGMLEAISGSAELIDANEEAYYYTSALEYYRIRQILADDAMALIPPELRAKHLACLRIGHAISADYICGNWLGMSPFPYKLTAQGLMMTPKDKAAWFEHNAYYALKTSDRYAWLYTEDMNWWKNDKLPEGFQDALLRAKAKVNAGEPLGFEIEKTIRKAQDKAEETYKDKKQENK